MTANKRLALAAAILGSFVVVVDSTAVNVALPAIRDDLGGGLAAQQWISNAYLLTLGSLILIGGSLADIFGERRVFSLGVAGFGATSILCAVAPSSAVLIAARALQGGFGALLTPASLALLIAVFPARERGRAIGSWTAWGSIGVVIGPLLGGLLVDSTSWRWIFAVNVPFVIATLVLVRRAVPARPPNMERRHVDWLGALLTALGLAGPVLALIRQPEVGWASPQVIVPAVVGFALLGAFLVHEHRAREPMLPLGMFRRRNFAAGNLETFAMYGGLGATFFFLTLFLQQVAGYSAFEAGLATVPTSIVMFLLSRRAGALADRVGPHVFMTAGPLTAGAGLLLFQRVGADVDYVTELLPALLIFSLGLTATVAPLTTTVLSDADDSNAGIASGVNNAIARVAGLVAIAALGAVVAAQFSSALDDNLAGRRLDTPARAAVTEARRQTLARADPERAGPVVAHAVEASSVHAFHVGEAVAAVLVMLGGIIGLLGIRNPPPCSGTDLTGPGARVETCIGVADNLDETRRDRRPVLVGEHLHDDEPPAVDDG